MNTIIFINYAIATVFFVCYAYQIFYILVSLFKSPKEHKTTVLHNYAILISARNEAAVIGQLLESINNQSYNSNRITTFVIADNCTDNTAEIARKHGAHVYERFNTQKVGKGYALDALLGHIEKDFGANTFDAFMVFDADNVLDVDYVKEMNKTFSDGYQIITSYRNSKNYGDNWISAGYALWFLRESRYLNYARMLMNVSCTISGTGFLFSREILEEDGGWKFHLLTEDIEFTAYHVIEGKKIGYCHSAVVYDEQPTEFSQSWNQRLRWAKGFLQVFKNYGHNLFVTGLKGSFSAFDMTMTIMPAMILSLLGIILNITTILTGLYFHSSIMVATASRFIFLTFVNLYLLIFAIGGITLITEWHNIHTTAKRKIASVFTFPLFMMTYLPIAFTAIFKKVEWTPISHTKVTNLESIINTSK